MALKSQMVHLSQVSGNRFISSILYRRLIGISAAVYGARYISDRFLPDKAIDLVDEAASALRLAQESKPDELESLEREIMTLQIELESLKKEMDIFSVERRNKVEADLLVKRQEVAALTAVWQAGALLEVLGFPSMYLNLSLQNVTDWRRSR